MAVEIRELQPTKRNLLKFVHFPIDTLYRDSKYFVPPLVTDELNTLRPDKNPAFDFCEAVYYMAYRDGKPVGRVAGIINHVCNERSGKKEARFSYIDFIDDAEVVDALIDTVTRWGKSKGMEHLTGPLSFTDMDPEGMLIEGFDRIGTTGAVYSHPYYPKHMERLGFVKDADWVELLITIPKEIPEKYTKVARVVESRYNLHTIKFTRKMVYQGGYGQKMFELVNESFKDLYGYSEMTPRQIRQYLDMWMPLVHFDFVTGVIDSNNNDELIGIAITIPSLSHAVKKCRRGRLLPFGWWHVLQALKFGKTNIVDLMLIAIKPEYRAKGANALVFSDLIPVYQKYGIEWGETQVEMETNEKVQSQWGPLNPIHHKSRRCYIKKISDDRD